MKKLFFIYFILFNSSIFGQKSEIGKMVKRADSLEQLYKYEASLKIWEKLTNNNKDTNFAYHLGRKSYALAKLEIDKGNYEQAKAYLLETEKQFLKCTKTKELKKLLSTTYLEISYCTWDWEQALKENKKGLAFTERNLPNDENIVHFMVDQGNIYRRSRKYEQSIVALEKAIKKINRLTPKDYENLGYTHNLLGIAYSDLHIHNQSLYHYTKGMEFHQKANSEDKAYLVNSMNNVIWENLDYGDVNKAREVLTTLNKNFYRWYKNKNFATTDAGNFKEYHLHFRALLYLSNLRIQMYDEKVEESKKYLDSVAFIFDKYPDSRKKIDNTLLLARYDFDYLYASLVKKEQSKQDEHIKFLKKTLEIAKFSESKHDELVAYLKLAIAYNRYKKWDEALAVIEASKKINETFFNASRFTIEVLEATVNEAKGNNEKARQVLVNTFQKLLPKDKKIQSLKKIKYTDFKNFNSSTFLRNTVNAAAIYFLLYEKTKNKEDLLVSNTLYFLASDMFTEFYQKGKYNASLKTFNQEIASGLLKTQLVINPNDQQKIKSILNRIENNASQHLWNIFESKNSQQLKVPASLIRNLNELVFERNTIEQQLELSNETKQLKNELAVLDKKIAQVKAKISQKDPSFETFKSANFSIDNVQKKLNQDQVIIKYIVTNKKVYAYSIQQDDIKMVEIGDTPELNTLVKNHLANINSIQSHYIKTGKKLYDICINPLIQSSSTSKIIFIPEDFLTALAFETLADKKGRLCIEKQQPSYAYSLKLWEILKDKKSIYRDNQFVSFAPNYPKVPSETQMRGLRRADLFDLAEAKKEAKKISDLLDGKLYLNEEANRTNFLQATTNFSLHHLAMHSVVEEDYTKSSLVFSGNQKVLFDELYQLNFPSDLVVLSACNTGIGAMESGEGMMSLSRALTYSGVKSSVYSLWQVPDKETSEIMIAFYENLKEGQSKDEALANAKRVFIQKNPMKNHPFYWAGFVVNGDVSPIVEDYFWWKFLGGMGIIFLLVLLFVKWKSNNSKLEAK